MAGVCMERNLDGDRHVVDFLPYPGLKALAGFRLKPVLRPSRCAQYPRVGVPPSGESHSVPVPISLVTPIAAPSPKGGACRPGTSGSPVSPDSPGWPPFPLLTWLLASLTVSPMNPSVVSLMALCPAALRHIGEAYQPPYASKTSHRMSPCRLAVVSYHSIPGNVPAIAEA